MRLQWHLSESSCELSSFSLDSCDWSDNSSTFPSARGDTGSVSVGSCVWLRAGDVLLRSSSGPCVESSCALERGWKFAMPLEPLIGVLVWVSSVSSSVDKVSVCPYFVVFFLSLLLRRDFLPWLISCMSIDSCGS